MSSKPDSDDSDDWFNKDIDDFDLPDIKKPLGEGGEISPEVETGASLLESLKIKPKQFFDGKICRGFLVDLCGFQGLNFHR